MKVNGRPTRTIWLKQDGETVRILDQTRFPHRYETADLTSVDDAARAIADMQVRGAPLIGATAAFGMALAMRADASDANLAQAAKRLLATRPTAVNLRWALERMQTHLAPIAEIERRAAAYEEATRIADEDVAINAAIGAHGLPLIKALADKKPLGEPVNIMTHCNAGWLATVDWGTATAPIYKAHDQGIAVHVWVSETRPRNQGDYLTAWELGQHGVPHTVIVDNAAGHLMQRGRVDMVVTGTDRTTAAGDVCNKIGTYLKALAAHENGIPFYVALPSPTIDFTLTDGLRGIPIEERSPGEVRFVSGRREQGEIVSVDILPKSSPALNPAFDVTPARLVTGLITEKGVTEASLAGLAPLKP
ncbi:MAG: S-methyl-5-thioribose-1-phosphate isomerase [Paracoccaceae bacterium]